MNPHKLYRSCVGLSYGSSEMEGDFFVNNIILSAVELPGYLVVLEKVPSEDS